MRSSVLVSGSILDRNTSKEIIGEFKYYFAIITIGEKLLDIWLDVAILRLALLEFLELNIQMIELIWGM